jgi:hypothetical protein
MLVKSGEHVYNSARFRNSRTPSSIAGKFIRRAKVTPDSSDDFSRPERLKPLLPQG